MSVGGRTAAAAAAATGTGRRGQLREGDRNFDPSDDTMYKFDRVAFCTEFVVDDVLFHFQILQFDIS